MQLGEPAFDSTPLSWAPVVDLLGVRLDRRLLLQQHARRLVQRTAPRIEDLRRLFLSQRRAPAWVGLLLYRSLVRPVLAYAAPVLSLACLSAWDILSRLERRGLRAALRLPRDSDVADLLDRTAALGTFVQHCRRLGAGFLGRHVRQWNLRLMSAFCTEVDQHSDRLRVDGPLERLLTWAPDTEKPALASAIRHLVDPPTPQLPGRPSRSRLEPAPDPRWGTSPW